ncbi:hypothetical protein G7Y89_g10643 [Cudoniella acicularis]|uniref:Beta-xylanase n=1 Tax=Cudoniella acicularis TaxID=354080 RepID=A0A8H4RDW8_9HELO|nr:hypothetical protein G7Y89_g10643 [Cudoniella acicularis]
MRFSPVLPAAALLPQVFGQLNALAKAKGLKYFGSATDNGELSDTTYLAILSNTREFGQITPGNTQKWEYTEPTQDTYSYTEGDVITALAAENDQLVRCHNLVCEFLESSTMHSILTYQSTIGPEYIPIAFETAALYDSTAKLYYNDYNIEYSGAKATAALNLVTSLKTRGIKIDGVGLQAHFIVGSTPSLSAQTTNLESFTALGVEVAYTELDIRFSSLPPTDAGLSQQSSDYANTVSACLAVTDCVGVTVWDFTDKYSWIPSVFSGAGDACLWYANYTEHPAYAAVVNVLGGSVSLTSTATVASATSSAVKVVSTTLATSTTLAITATSSAASTTTTATSSESIAKWGQCGGSGWTSTGTCASGSTCTYSNEWYSQCL